MAPDSPIAVLIDRLSQSPEQIASMARELTVDQVRLKPSSDEFSVLESVCHLRDIEIEAYRVRIERILTEDRPVLADVNGAQLAVMRDYNTQDLESALKAYKKARQQNVERLRATLREQMSRTGVLEGVGEISVGRLAEMMRQHDKEHLLEMRSLCRAQGWFEPDS